MSTVDLKQIMPLFDPIYDQQYFDLFSTIKQRIIAKCFDSQTNRLCEKLLKDDPSNYNAWYAKKMYIFQEHPDLKQERKFANSCLGEKAKSFQVWEHKRFLSELMEEYEEDLTLIEKVLIQKDTKNYHAWSYRVWLIERIGRYEQELTFAEKMVAMDHYNNSAWSYRFFLVGKLLELQNYQSQQVRNKFLSGQVEYALKSIKLYRQNKASWNYLRGLFPSIRLQGIPSTNSITKPLLTNYAEYPDILASCVAMWEAIKNKIKQNQGKDESGLLFAIERQILTTLVHIYSQNEQNKQFAKNACLQLAEKDRQRVYYWQWVHKNL